MINKINMNNIAGSISYTWEINLESELSIKYVVNKIKNDFYNIFLVWNTNINSSLEFLENFRWKLNWKILGYDISISTEDKINILNNWNLEWKYSFLAINWSNFDDVLNKYSYMKNIISIREAEESKVLWNRVIKIDLIN